MGGFSLKNKKVEIIKSNEFQNLFDKSKQLIDSARSNMGQMANVITVLTNFLLGRYIVHLQMNTILPESHQLP